MNLLYSIVNFFILNINLITFLSFYDHLPYIQHYFWEQILKQIKTYSCLDEGEYKHGLYEALDEIIF